VVVPRYTKIINRDFVLFECIVILTNISFAMIMPVMSGAAISFGAGGALMGLAAGMYAIISLVSRPFTNPLVDTLNKRRQYRFGLVLYIISYTGLALSKGVGPLIAFRCLQGLGMGIMGPVSAALAGLYVPEDKAAAGIGANVLLSTAANMAIGPVLSGFIVEHMGYSACFLAAGMMCVACLALTLCITDLDRDGAAKYRMGPPHLPKFEDFFCRECLVPGIMTCCFTMVYGCMYSFMFQAAQEHGVPGIDIFFTIYAITTVIIRPATAALGDRFGQGRLIAPCALVAAVGLAVCANAHSLAMYLVAAVLLAIGYGSASIVLLVICAQRVRPERRGLACGTYYMGMDLGTGVGPVIGGVVAFAFGYGGMMYFLIIPVVLGAVIGCVAPGALRPLGGEARKVQGI
jgi:MFS family permease